MQGSTLAGMNELSLRRWPPFAVVGAILLVVCVAVARLPDSFLAQMERNRTFSGTEAGWAYRLLVIAAVAQAIYGGFVALRIERVRRARAEDRKVRRMSRAKILKIVTRNAAGMIVWTLIYGIASLALTGQRGGFWLFPLLAVAQGAWCYRQTGEIGRWLAFQPEAETGSRRSIWVREPADYCPPLARGLTPLDPEDTAQPTT